MHDYFFLARYAGNTEKLSFMKQFVEEQQAQILACGTNVPLLKEVMGLYKQYNGIMEPHHMGPHYQFQHFNFGFGCYEEEVVSD